MRDRSSFKAGLAARTGITLWQAVLGSAFVSAHPENGICLAVGPDAAARVAADRAYLGLRADFQLAWSYAREFAATGQTANDFVSALYRTHERLVMAVVEEALGAPASSWTRVSRARRLAKLI